MDRDTAQAWLDRYVEAWKSFDPEAIASLFSDDARYRYHPYDPEDETVVGRDAIAADWVAPDGDAGARDAAGSYDAHYDVWAVDGDRVVALGWSRYWTDATRATLERTYHNVFLMRFDAEGRCREFTELYMKEPDPAT